MLKRDGSMLLGQGQDAAEQRAAAQAAKALLREDAFSEIYGMLGRRGAGLGRGGGGHRGGQGDADDDDDDEANPGDNDAAVDDPPTSAVYREQTSRIACRCGVFGKTTRPSGRQQRMNGQSRPRTAA